MATNILNLKELMLEAVFHMISLREVVFGSKLGL